MAPVLFSYGGWQSSTYTAAEVQDPSRTLPRALIAGIIIGVIYWASTARLIRARQPWAILFLEGQVSTNCGLQSWLPRPAFGGVAYAPHYYKPSTIVFHAWFGSSLTIDLAFSNMETKAEQWNAPLFLGEFGCEAGMIAEALKPVH